MKGHWRKIASLLPLAIEKMIYSRYFQRLHARWLQSDRAFPPSHLTKQQKIKKLAALGRYEVLVETGTYLGDMVFAMKDNFKEIYSIELSPHFFQKAELRFHSLKHIKIIEGDSGKVLKNLVPKLKSPALFWLDGHYSGGQTALGDKECPIYEELHAILESPFSHAIIVDDARLFIGKNDYPTIDELQKFVMTNRPGSRFELENDAIIITYN